MSVFDRRRRRRRDAYGTVLTAEELGDTIRERRRALGLSQTKLAEYAGCSQRFVSELERGVAGGGIRRVLEVCHALGMDVFVRVRGE